MTLVFGEELFAICALIFCAPIATHIGAAIAAQKHDPGKDGLFMFGLRYLMSALSTQIALVILPWAATGCIPLHAASFPQPVQIDTGALTGIQSIQFPNVTRFEGIPFAAPPVGDLRWKPPIPPRKWKGVLKADHLSPVCAQVSRTMLMFPFITKEFFPDLAVGMSEDCLYLNVWTPAKSAADKLPVIVWIHGGAFQEGSTSVPSNNGQGLAAKGVVVVAINYRLGILGFLASPELDMESPHRVSGNYGFLDQIEALKWVHRNIASFGGDPDRVTIAGQSSGAGSVNFLTISPLAKGLFQRGIAQSGTRYMRDPGPTGNNPMTYKTLRDAEADDAAYLDKCGVDVAKLRKMSMEEINKLPFPPFPPAFFGPNVDGWVLPAGYDETYSRGAQNDVPIIAGGTADEGGANPGTKTTVPEYRQWAKDKFGDMAEEFLKLYPAGTDNEATKQRLIVARDWQRSSIYLWAHSWQGKSRNKTFIYQWNHVYPGPNQEANGAFHGSDIPYVLNSLWTVPERPFKDDDRSVANMMASYWANFAATGDPNGKGLAEWPAFSPDSRVAMQLGDKTGVIPVATDSRFEFFKRFFDTHLAK